VFLESTSSIYLFIFPRTIRIVMFRENVAIYRHISTQSVPMPIAALSNLKSMALMPLLHRSHIIIAIVINQNPKNCHRLLEKTLMLF
jgi:hypothetical protein